MSEPLGAEQLATTLSLELTRTGGRYIATATLLEASSGAPISGQTIDFMVSDQPVDSAITNDVGRAQIALRANQLGPRDVLSAVFAGTSDYGASTAERTR